MKLAFKELSYYKFKYLLITMILFLLAFLVMFVSSLAQGLGKDNISLIESFNGQHIVINKDADNQLNQSLLTEEDTQTVKDKDLNILSMGFITLKNNDKVALVHTNDIEPKVVKGHAPKSKDDVLINEKLSENLKIGDTVKIKDSDITYKISGFTKQQMFAHTSVGFVTEDGMKKFNPKMIPNIAITNKSVKTSDFKEAKVITQKQLMEGIPSYQAEQMPLNLMVVFLFVISAIVISAFFYVITIQKTREYGILKAIGTKNPKIALTIFTEVITIVLVSTLLAIGVIYLIDMFMPVTMPFYLNNQLVLLLLGLFIIVSLIGALMSVIKVMKIDPLSAIGGE